MHVIRRHCTSICRLVLTDSVKLGRQSNQNQLKLENAVTITRCKRREQKSAKNQYHTWSEQCFMTTLNFHISLLTFCTKMKVNSSKRRRLCTNIKVTSLDLLERSQQKTTAIQVHSNVKLEEEEEKKPQQNSSTYVTNINQSLAQVKAMSKEIRRDSE